MNSESHKNNILSEDFNYTGNKWEEDFENKEFPVELIKIELLLLGQVFQIRQLW